MGRSGDALSSGSDRYDPDKNEDGGEGMTFNPVVVVGDQRQKASRLQSLEDWSRGRFYREKAAVVSKNRG